MANLEYYQSKHKKLLTYLNGIFLFSVSIMAVQITGGLTFNIGFFIPLNNFSIAIIILILGSYFIEEKLAVVENKIRTAKGK